jgi:hypothetical protein
MVLTHFRNVALTARLVTASLAMPDAHTGTIPHRRRGGLRSGRGGGFGRWGGVRHFQRGRHPATNLVAAEVARAPKSCRCAFSRIPAGGHTGGIRLEIRGIDASSRRAPGRSPGIRRESDLEHIETRPQEGAQPDMVSDTRKNASRPGRHPGRQPLPGSSSCG